MDPTLTLAIVAAVMFWGGWWTRAQCDRHRTRRVDAAAREFTAQLRAYDRASR